MQVVRMGSLARAQILGARFDDEVSLPNCPFFVDSDIRNLWTPLRLVPVCPLQTPIADAGSSGPS
jgi:hypothetical protein